MDELVSGEAVVIEVPPARFPSRLAALLIDLAAQAAALGATIWVVLGVGTALDSAAAAAITLTVAVAVIVGYPTVSETLSRGRTLGKLALGLRVVGDDGSPERFRQALIRALAAVLEIWTFSGAPALIASMLSARGKRLGDLFAGTFVVQERQPRRSAAVPGMPPALATWAATLELSALPDSLAGAALRYLRGYWHLTAQAREQLGWSIAASVAEHTSPPPPPGTPPPEFLAAVIAERHARAAGRAREAGGEGSFVMT